MQRPRTSLLVTMVAALTIAGTGCSDDARTKSEPPSTTRAAGIGQERAIAIARRAWAGEEPEFDFSSRRAEISERGRNYDIAFVDRELSGARGEPHVVIDRFTGAVRDTYRTR